VHETQPSCRVWQGIGVEHDMTTTARRASAYNSILAAVGAAVLGLCIVTVTGHVQAHTLHDAAHDIRHANGLPCH